jgi:hypothetical protein
VQEVLGRFLKEGAGSFSKVEGEEVSKKKMNRKRKDAEINRERGGEKRRSWVRIFKLLRSPGIHSKESISPAYVAWRVGTITLFLLDILAPVWMF